MGKQPRPEQEDERDPECEKEPVAASDEQRQARASE
jgi:hypothetical protein